MTIATLNEPILKPAEIHEFHLPITSEETLKTFIWQCFGVVIPNTVVIPGHSTPWRAFCDAYFAVNRVVVWKASRGFGGKSFLLALLTLVEAMTLKCDVSILGGSGQQSKKVQSYISQEFYEHESSPRHLWLGIPLVTKSRFIWGNEIEALMASTKAARGGHPPRMRLDEIDEMSEEVYDAVTGQAMSKTKDGKVIVAAQTVMSSTHHRPNGMMTKTLKRAKKRGWIVHEWSYHETSNPIDGWLLPEEIEGKKTEVTGRMWTTEYDLQEPSVKDRAIITESVDDMFGVNVADFHYKDWPEIDGEAGIYYEFEAPEIIDSGADYYTMADWAKDVDWCIFMTIRVDVEPARVVAWERRGREKWPAMVKRFEYQVNRYNSWASHDSTGVGDVVDDYLEVWAEGYKFVGQARLEMINAAIGAIEDLEIICPYIEYFYNELKYMEVGDYIGSAGHLPDTMASFASGWRLYREHNPKVIKTDLSELGQVTNFKSKYD